MLRIETLHRPAETLEPVRAAALRSLILDLNLRLSDAPAFRANWQARIDGFFDELEWVDLAWAGDRLVGHYGMRRLEMGRTVGWYVDNFTVDPAHQGQGVGRALTGRANRRLALRALGRSVHVFSRTQNPVVAAECRAAFGAANSFPAIDDRPAPPELRAMARSAAATLWPDLPFDEETGVLAGAYGGPFLNVAPTRHADVAAHFARHVDLERGDAVVQVLRLTPGSWAHMARYFVGHALRRTARRPRRAMDRPALA